MNTSLGLDDMGGIPALSLQGLTMVTWPNGLHFHSFSHCDLLSVSAYLVIAYSLVLVWNPGPLTC